MGGAIGSGPVRAGLAWARPEWGRDAEADPSRGAGERLEAAGCRVEGPVTPPEWARAEPGREEAVVGREERSGTRERREGGERHAYEAHTGGK